MGDLMPGIPSVPGDETTWAAAVDQFETLKKGDMPLSLTNWDDLDLVPSIAAGAGIEIAGATYRFTVESLISDEAGLVAGTVYVVIKTADPTVNEATAYFTNVAPTWRDDLNGWYDATGENRYTGHVMDWDGASAYTAKATFSNSAGGMSLMSGINGMTGVEGFWGLPAVGAMIIPAGAYVMALDSADTSGYLLYEVMLQGVWTKVFAMSGIGIPEQQPGLSYVVSDGINYRLNNAIGTFDHIVNYRKIW